MRVTFLLQQSNSQSDPTTQASSCQAAKCLPGVCSEGESISLVHKTPESHGAICGPAIWPCSRNLEKSGIFQVFVAVQTFVEGMTPCRGGHIARTGWNGENGGHVVCDVAVRIQGCQASESYSSKWTGCAKSTSFSWQTHSCIVASRGAFLKSRTGRTVNMQPGPNLKTKFQFLKSAQSVCYCRDIYRLAPLAFGAASLLLQCQKSAEPLW